MYIYMACVCLWQCFTKSTHNSIVNTEVTIESPNQCDFPLKGFCLFPWERRILRDQESSIYNIYAIVYLYYFSSFWWSSYKLPNQCFLLYSQLNTCYRRLPQPYCSILIFLIIFWSGPLKVLSLLRFLVFYSFCSCTLCRRYKNGIIARIKSFSIDVSFLKEEEGRLGGLLMLKWHREEWKQEPWLPNTQVDALLPI